MNYSPHQLLVFEKTKEKNRKIATKDLAIHELTHLEYPNHKTAVYIMSQVENPDYVVIYTYGGTVPHMFSLSETGEITEECKLQFTWEWMKHWLSQKVAIVIFDMPSYFAAGMFTTSFYRLSKDRMRESLALIDLVKSKFPKSKIAWHGLSYGTHEAAKISQVETAVEKVVLSSGPWHVLEDFDDHHQGARLDWYDITTAKVPVLVVQHKLEKLEKATEAMSKTDSITVSNSVSSIDGHFFRGRQASVVKSICDWLRGHPYPKELL